LLVPKRPKSGNGIKKKKKKDHHHHRSNKKHSDGENGGFLLQPFDAPPPSSIDNINQEGFSNIPPGTTLNDWGFGEVFVDGNGNENSSNNKSPPPLYEEYGDRGSSRQGGNRRNHQRRSFDQEEENGTHLPRTLPSPRLEGIENHHPNSDRRGSKDRISPRGTTTIPPLV